MKTAFLLLSTPSRPSLWMELCSRSLESSLEERATWKPRPDAGMRRQSINSKRKRKNLRKSLRLTFSPASFYVWFRVFWVYWSSCEQLLDVLTDFSLSNFRSHLSVGANESKKEGGRAATGAVSSSRAADEAEVLSEWSGTDENSTPLPQHAGTLW